MIGVTVQEQERETAAEFFELFKTPWEFCREGRPYRVLLSTQPRFAGGQAKVVLFFNGGVTQFDHERGLQVRPCLSNPSIACQEQSIPLYGRTVTFVPSAQPVLCDAETQVPLALAWHAGETTVARIGYDLFGEVQTLLAGGQPPANASKPTLELHIAVLRDLITKSGESLLEIPPIPEGYNFIACLTHDIDHPSLRNHRWDHTMFGFLYRAAIGSLKDTLRGRKPLSKLLRNWAAAGRLPLVYMGLADDPWRGFDRYLDIEAGRRGTYFVIPRSNDAGRRADGPAPARRAARYSLQDIQPQLDRIRSAGGEVAVHGIDAWNDCDKAIEERRRVYETSGAPPAGVRMHWLYFDNASPAVLEAAGYTYDSTIGYNETVGFRAGTLQGFRPAGAATLLELPLHIMDTALFYPCYLNLDETGARARILKLLDQAARFGGALTINWHDRSIAPERLWEEFYVELIEEVKKRRAWFATASQTVAWFKMRRSTRFETTNGPAESVRVSVPAGQPPGLPGLRLRLHPAKGQSQSRSDRIHLDLTFEEIRLHKDTATPASSTLGGEENRLDAPCVEPAGAAASSDEPIEKIITL
jgi:hypothetical protein